VKTDTLIDLLATGAGTAQRHAVTRRFLAAVGSGTAGALLLLLAVFGVNPVLRDYLTLPQYWMKVAFTFALAAGGFQLSRRFARPGVPAGAAVWSVLLPMLAMWILAAVVLLGADASARSHLILGDSWNVCPFNIAFLSAPAFIATIWAMRGLAPTESRSAGAAAGLCAGALGAAVYCLFCPELAAPFLAIWYVIGILIPSVVGFLLGPRLLRW